VRIIGLVVLGTIGCSGGDSDTPTQVDTGLPPPTELPAVYINEFMASNTSTIQDESGRYPDWIELFNASEAEADLSGWWLSDDIGEPFSWQIPDGVTIPAGGHLLIWADNDTSEGLTHASFQLAAEGGEDIALFGPNVLDNPLIDSVEQFGVQQPDISLARLPDGSASWQVDTTPTPEAPND
jgi:hypothetical protein